MSLHNSLKSKNTKQRNVLNKIERLKKLYPDGNIKKVFHLPKTKIIRIKIMKNKKEEDKKEIIKQKLEKVGKRGK